MKSALHNRFLLMALAIALVAATAMLLLSNTAAAQAGAPPLRAADLPAAWGYIAAAVATGLSALGAGFAVARLGTAAVGALAEKPELLGRLLIFVGLAEGIAIYGVIISVLILQKLP